MLFVDRLLQTLQRRLDANQRVLLTSTETQTIARLVAQASTQQLARARPVVSSIMTFSSRRVHLRTRIVSIVLFDFRYSVLTHRIE